MIVEMRWDMPGLTVYTECYYKEKYDFDAPRERRKEKLGESRRVLLDGRCIGAPRYFRWNLDGSRQWVGFEPIPAMIGGRA